MKIDVLIEVFVSAASVDSAIINDYITEDILSCRSNGPRCSVQLRNFKCGIDSESAGRNTLVLFWEGNCGKPGNSFLMTKDFDRRCGFQKVDIESNPAT